jgi:vacuolar-type H+-ATPase subunit F/Vma7
LITDGIINDMQKTIDEIVRGSSLPLSIIIVGVGQEDFSSMQVLDADDEPLYSKT